MSLNTAFINTTHSTNTDTSLTAINFITAAPKPVRKLAIFSGFECDNPQIQIRMNGHTYYVHDQGSHEDYSSATPWIKTSAEEGFNLTEIIDGTDPENPVLVNPASINLTDALNRVACTKRASCASRSNTAPTSVKEIIQSRLLQPEMP